MFLCPRRRGITTSGRSRRSASRLDAHVRVRSRMQERVRASVLATTMAGSCASARDQVGDDEVRPAQPIGRVVARSGALDDVMLPRSAPRRSWPSTCRPPCARRCRPGARGRHPRSGGGQHDDVAARRAWRGVGRGLSREDGERCVLNRARTEAFAAKSAARGGRRRYHRRALRTNAGAALRGEPRGPARERCVVVGEGETKRAPGFEPRSPNRARRNARRAAGFLLAVA